MEVFEKCREKLVFSVKTLGNNGVLFPLQSVELNIKMRLNLISMSVYVYICVYNHMRKTCPVGKCSLTLELQAQDLETGC